MSTHSADGREWAKLSEMKAGDVLIPDDGFTCGIAAAGAEVKEDEKGLYVGCDEGKHYLEGQVSEDDNDHLVGFWPLLKAES